MWLEVTTGGVVIAVMQHKVSCHLSIMKLPRPNCRCSVLIWSLVYMYMYTQLKTSHTILTYSTLGIKKSGMMSHHNKRLPMKLFLQNINVLPIHKSFHTQRYDTTTGVLVSNQVCRVRFPVPGVWGVTCTRVSPHVHMDTRRYSTHGLCATLVGGLCSFLLAFGTTAPVVSGKRF